MDKHPMKKSNLVLILLLIVLSFFEPYSEDHEFMALQDEVFNAITEKTLLISTEGFLRKEVFYSDLSQTTTRIAMDPILAAILPHHNVAHSYLNRFYQSVSTQEIDLIVLISPSHYDSMKRFSLIQNDYDSYEGVLKYHEEIVNDLLKNPFFKPWS